MRQKQISDCDSQNPARTRLVTNGKGGAMGSELASAAFLERQTSQFIVGWDDNPIS